MNGRDRHGVAASALSVAKLPYEHARDGISLTTTITPEGLGHVPGERAAISSASWTPTWPPAAST